MGSFHQIVAAVDASAMTEEVLKRAIGLSARHGANLLVLHVLDVPVAEWPFAASIDLQKVKEKIDAQIERLNNEGVACSSLVLQGDPADIVTVEAARVKADLLVIGAHGKEEVESGYFGSTIRKIVQQIHRPVLVVKNRAAKGYDRMTAPTNLTDYSEASIRFATEFFANASLKCLYAFNVMSDLHAEFYIIEKDEVEDLRKELAETAKVNAEAFAQRVGAAETVTIGKVGSGNDELLKYLTDDKPDLVVLGSKGVDDLNSYIFGSTASYLLQQCQSDVLVYVPDGQ
jgi:nucleotide-binding universal stress UspA family protein